MYAALSKPKEALLLHVLIFETICQKVYCIVILCYFLLFFTTNVLNITCLHTSRSRVSFQGDPEALTKSCQFELFDGYTQGVRDNEVFVEVKVRTEDPIQPAAPSGVVQHVGGSSGIFSALSEPKAIDMDAAATTRCRKEEKWQPGAKCGGRYPQNCMDGSAVQVQPAVEALAPERCWI